MFVFLCTVGEVLFCLLFVVCNVDVLHGVFNLGFVHFGQVLLDFFLVRLALVLVAQFTLNRVAQLDLLQAEPLIPLLEEGLVFLVRVERGGRELFAPEGSVGGLRG